MVSLESMPDYVIERIASNLQPKDVIACSAVCRKWREKFNIDNVWLPHLQMLDRHFKIQEKYKDMILCPPYIESLEPLCAARANYIREQCLHYNCRAGCFTVETLRPRLFKKVNQMGNMIDEKGNYWLFLNTFSAIEVWNVTNKPFFQGFALKNMSHDMDNLYVLNKKVVLIFCDFVQVFSFTSPFYELELEHTLFFYGDFAHGDIESNVLSSFCDPNAKHICNNNIFVGYSAVIGKNMFPVASFHIWDLETVTKLKKVKIAQEHILEAIFNEIQQHPKIRLIVQVFNGDSKKLVVSLQVANEDNRSALLILDLERLSYLPLVRFTTRRTSIVWCCIVNKRLILFGYVYGEGVNVSVINLDGTHIVSHYLGKFGVDSSSEFFLYGNIIYIQTGEEILTIEMMEDKFHISQLLKDTDFTNQVMYVVGLFVITKSSEGYGKLWDKDRGSIIRELPSYYGDIDVSKTIGLNNVHFPPKLIYVNFDADSVITVLSFW